MDDGRKLITGHAYITAIKLRLGLILTKMRAARGRPAASVMYDIGCERPASLVHVLQVCPTLARKRTKRHDQVLALLVTQLTRKGFTVLRKPTIIITAGVRKPDIVVYNYTQCAVLDVQMVADISAGPTLQMAHDLKTPYYNTEEFTSWLRERSGLSSLIST